MGKRCYLPIKIRFFLNAHSIIGDFIRGIDDKQQDAIAETALNIVKRGDIQIYKATSSFDHSLKKGHCVNVIGAFEDVLVFPIFVYFTSKSHGPVKKTFW